MPPPQCPECGRFLATAFVNQIKATATPCPRCGTSLFLGDGSEPVAHGEAPAATAAAADVPEAEAEAEAVAEPEAEAHVPAVDDDPVYVESSATDVAEPVEVTTEVVAEIEVEDDDEVVTITLDEAPVPAPPAVATDGALGSKAQMQAASLLVEAPADASVRPADLADDGASVDPLAGWDVGPEPATDGATSPLTPELAIASGAGLVLGLLLGGRDRRALGGVLGAVLGALLARLRS